MVQGRGYGVQVLAFSGCERAFIAAGWSSQTNLAVTVYAMHQPLSI